jgi:hypothetical protein
MPRKKTKEYKTYSFKCLVGRDDDLIQALETERLDRSRFIRDMLVAALDLPRPIDPVEPVSVDILRAELEKAVGVILGNLPVGGGVTSVRQPRQLRDVNNKGQNIPDF